MIRILRLCLNGNTDNIVTEELHMVIHINNKEGSNRPLIKQKQKHGVNVAENTLKKHIFRDRKSKRERKKDE